MIKRNWLRKTINYFGIFLLCTCNSLFAGIGYYPQYDYDRWGFSRSDYGQPKPGYGYVTPLVIKVQQKLKDRGYDPGDIDGSWGEMTSKALLEFQKDLNITKTGWIDIKTRDLLFGQVNLPFNLIKRVQRILNDAGFDLGSIDGLWGKRTEDALKSYQRSNGLRPTGLLDEKTRELLLE